MNPTIEEIQEVLKIFLDSELQDIRLEIGNVRLAVSKSGAPAPQPFSSPAPAPAVATAAAPAVTAPSVGVFYRRPSPDQAPFVQVGSDVAANDPVCLIEVMKMFTGVVAPCKGRVAAIMIEDATMVEYGQPLMYIEPT